MLVLIVIPPGCGEPAAFDWWPMPSGILLRNGTDCRSRSHPLLRPGVDSSSGAKSSVPSPCSLRVPSLRRQNDAGRTFTSWARLQALQATKQLADAVQPKAGRSRSIRQLPSEPGRQRSEARPQLQASARGGSVPEPHHRRAQGGQRARMEPRICDARGAASSPVAAGSVTSESEEGSSAGPEVIS
jgi:hypothetical protein